jgi:hypothetical protein
MAGYHHDRIIKQKQRPMPTSPKSILITFGVLSPAFLSAVFLIHERPPIPYDYFVSCGILLLAVFDFVTVVFIEQYRKRLGTLTMAALLGTIFIVMLFMIATALNRFFEYLGYGYLIPFIGAAMLLIYAAAFIEKNLVLKIHLSLNSLALALLWTMGATDKVMMPF